MASTSRPKSPPQVRRIDRRVLRTRQALRDALLQLLVEKGWDALDIQALCDRANIGRSTFYLHFDNKEALLSGSFADLGEALRAQAGPAGMARSGDLPWLAGLLDHVHEQQRVFRALLGRRSGHFVQERFRALLVELVAGDMPKTSASGWPAQAAAHYLGGALFELLVWWLSAARARSPRDIEALFKAWSVSVGEAP